MFAYNFLILNGETWNLLFFLVITSAILSQFLNLNKFKVGKKLLFILLGVLLTFITFFISFMISGKFFPYSAESNIHIFTLIVGFIFVILNFALLHTILTIFINKLKINNKNKSSYVKLIGIYFLVITIIETLILITTNKP